MIKKPADAKHKPSALKPVIKKTESTEEQPKPSALKPVIKKPSLKPVIKKTEPVKTISLQNQVH